MESSYPACHARPAIGRTGELSGPVEVGQGKKGRRSGAAAPAGKTFQSSASFSSDYRSKLIVGTAHGHGALPRDDADV